MARRWRRDVFAAKAAADAQSPTNIPGCGRRCCSLVEPSTLGDPMRPLLWVSKSLQKLAAALTSMGFPAGADTVGEELL